MIRLCTQDDVNSLYTIINDAARAYKGHIPEDCWHEPYMSLDQLLLELDAGVVFWGYEEDRKLVGVMGIQHVQDVSLIRHAYVRAACRGKGIGGLLISHLITLTGQQRPYNVRRRRHGRSMMRKALFGLFCDARLHLLSPKQRWQLT